MAQPTWITPAGSLGTFSENIPVSITISATPAIFTNTIKYSILNGDLPPSTSELTTFAINETTGQLTGTPAQVADDSVFSFTIRVYEYQLSTVVGISDRTFDMTISGSDTPSFVTPAGQLYTAPYYLLDTTWDPFQITILNPDPNTTAIVELVNGTLPPGLEINHQGLIRGYAAIPSGANQTYQFTLEVSSESGNALRNFEITVTNQDSIPQSRKPVIMNTRPPQYYIPETDVNKPFYINEDGEIGIFSQEDNYLFKIIGYDPDESHTLTYSLVGGSLPSGLSLNSSNGYITGVMSSSTNDVETFLFDVVVNNGIVDSDPQTFSMIVVKNINHTPIDISVQWLTPSNVGTIINGNTSLISVVAVNPSDYPLEYALFSGSLPTGLSLSSSGDIVGKLSFEPDTIVTPVGTSTEYTFTVLAINPEYAEISSTKEFTLTTYQKYSGVGTDSPIYENIYIKAYPSMEDRSILLDLLQSITVIPYEYVYRPADLNFGKASSVVYNHMYGVETSSVDTYINAITKNHYLKNMVLGPIKTAVAKDSSGQIIYEVVYSEVIDNLTRMVKSKLVSISKEMLWPQYINGVATVVYPNSLANMRQQVADEIPSILITTDSTILPLWMTSQQEDGGTIGYVQAWVLCYTKPGCSALVKASIQQNWNHQLNEIGFDSDKFEVNKSMTYDFNHTTNQWDVLPSGSTSQDTYDTFIYYPQKNILN